ncbi:unnamed protein product, partial [Candidula unifasciata]
MSNQARHSLKHRILYCLRTLLFTSFFVKIRTSSFSSSLLFLPLRFSNEKQYGVKPSMTDEQRLLKALVWNYDPAVRPVYDARTPVIIKLGTTLTQIIDVDEKNQVLTTNIWLDQEWHDEKLVWNISHYNNITKLRIPCDLIWLPDIVLYN